MLVLMRGKDSQFLTESIVPLLIAALMRADNLPLLGGNHAVQQRHDRSSPHQVSAWHLDDPFLQADFILDLPKVLNLRYILRRYFLLHDDII